MADRVSQCLAVLAEPPVPVGQADSTYLFLQLTAAGPPEMLLWLPLVHALFACGWLKGGGEFWKMLSKARGGTNF